MRWLVLFLFLSHGMLWAPIQATMDECMSEFINVAFNVTVESTNTGGSPPEEYSVQTGVTGVTKSCHTCDARSPALRHGAEYLTNYNSPQDTTWWQSQSMLAGVQYPGSINLTLILDCQDKES